MNLWGEDIPDALLTDEQACFLSEFTAKPRITIEEMWRHLDVAWTAMAPVSYTHLTLPTNREV